MATPGFAGNATLNGYRYFADGLGAADDLWTWLQSNGASHGVFSAGSTNTREYYMRFPNSAGIKYGYAIIANWGGPEPQNHPSNAPEAIACSVTYDSDVWYVDPAHNGGSLKFALNIWNWDSRSPGHRWRIISFS